MQACDYFEDASLVEELSHILGLRLFHDASQCMATGATFAPVRSWRKSASSGNSTVSSHTLQRGIQVIAFFTCIC